jgi:hypothetical protein
MPPKARQQSMFAQKTSSDLENTYIRIYISRPDEDFLSMVISKTSTIGTLAKQIEAHIWFETFEKGTFVSGELSDSKFVKVFQLYDASNIALPFASKVGDVLCFDDVISLTDSNLGSYI